MASVNRIDLINEALTGTTTTTKKSLELFSNEFICWLKVSAIGAGTTAAVKIQHSADGTNFLDLVTFTSLVAVTGFEIKVPTTPILPYVRGVATLTGGPTTATVDLAIYSDKVK